MGLFDIISSAASAVVKTALTPVAVVADVVDTAMGNDANNTKKHVKSIGDDVADTLDELMP